MCSAIVVTTLRMGKKLVPALAALISAVMLASAPAYGQGYNYSPWANQPHNWESCRTIPVYPYASYHGQSREKIESLSPFPGNHEDPYAFYVRMLPGWQMVESYQPFRTIQLRDPNSARAVVFDGNSGQLRIDFVCP